LEPNASYLFRPAVETKSPCYPSGFKCGFVNMQIRLYSVTWLREHVEYAKELGVGKVLKSVSSLRPWEIL